MTAEQLEELAGGANPAFMDLDLDHEEIITHLASRVLAAEKLVEVLPLGDGPLAQLVTAYREACK